MVSNITDSLLINVFRSIDLENMNPVNQCAFRAAASQTPKFQIKIASAFKA